MAHGMKRDDGLSLVYVKERTISKFLQAHDKDEVRWWVNQGFLVDSVQDPEKWAVAVGKLVLIDRDAANHFPAFALPAISGANRQNSCSLPPSARFPDANSSSQRLSPNLSTVHLAVTISLSILPAFPTFLYTIHDHIARLTHHISAS